jgi:4-diphosphocytidyl-2-C-methyl-D-erythritol kinase
MSAPRRAVARRASVPALAKVNLDLRVLGKRADGYHELRTIFQTISLADRIEITFTPGRKSEFALQDALEIPDNLAARAAHLAMEAMGASGRVEIRLEKRIPMGAGLGGGSSDAAAVLLALPVLSGGALGLTELSSLARQLGSDVPFFLLGGTAAGIGRGTELFPLPDRPAQPGVLIAPAVHVSTAAAYRGLSARLGTGLTTELLENKIFSFQSQAWGLRNGEPAVNDFEIVVFEQHRHLATLKKQLIRAGAETAMMTGSGSAVYGLFRSRNEASRALQSVGEENAFQISLVSRVRYRSLWWRALNEHMVGRVWPPLSRYLR